MKRSFWLLIFLPFFLYSQANAQEGFRIKGYPIKAKKSFLPFEFKLENLSWGSAKSECLNPRGTEIGVWFQYKASGPDLTVTVESGPKRGDIVEPIIYFGRVIDNKGTEYLVETTCAKANPGDASVSISVEGLKDKEVCYILVTSAKPTLKQRFAISTEPRYTAPAKEEMVAAEEQTTDYVIGRVRSQNGKAKAGVTVTLLDENMERIEEAQTDPEGSFHFKKLPTEEAVLTRIEEDDSELVVDMFLYDKEGNVKQRATKIGPSLYGFGAEKNAFTVLKLLTSSDWTLNVQEGKTGVVGRVVDSETFLYGQAGMTVGLYNAAKSRLATSVTDENGKFQFLDMDKGQYLVKLENPSPGTYSEIVLVDDLNVPYSYSNSSMLGTDGFFEFEKLPQEIVEMKRMEERDTRMKLPTDFSNMEQGKSIVLKNIFFESGSSTLLASSHTELDRLASALKEQSSLKIEIAGHTDNVGGASQNKILSESRAKEVHDYLVKAGIDKTRLTYVGYGHTKPKSSNETEEGRKQNRRVEFTILP